MSYYNSNNSSRNSWKVVKVCFSSPILRTDDSKARLTIKRMNDRMKNLEMICSPNVNIDEACLGKKGHNMNLRGVGRLVLNLRFLIRKL